MRVLKTAVKIVGVVAGIAAVATGFGAPLGAGILGASFGAIATGAALAGAALEALSPTKPASGSAVGSPTQWQADPQSGVPYIMGRTGFAGRIVHRDTFGGADNPFFGNVIVWSGGGPVQAFESFLIDRTAVTFSGNAIVGGLNGFAWLKRQLGACPEASALTPVNGSLPGWTSAHKLSGYCAGLFEVKFDKDGKKWAAGFPQSLIAVIQGAKVYDPRLDSTYPGGSGACRASNEATWVYSENPALHGITWSLGRHENGQRVLGVGIPVTGIDLPRWVEFANICDANGWKIGGVVSSLDDKWDVLKKICQCGAGRPIRLGGILSVDFEAPRVSLATVTSADLAGTPRVVGTRGRRSRINTLITRLRLESQGWEVTPLAPVSIPLYVTEDGGSRTREFDLELVQQADQAAELAAYEICNAREFGPITVPLQTIWMGYKPGDCLTLQIPGLGLAGQKAVIRRRSLDPQSVIVTHEFVSETDDKHDFALGRTGTPPPTPSLTPVDLSDVPAPGGGAWTAAPVVLAGGGNAALPALRVTGAVDNVNAEAIVIEYRVAGTTDWTGAELHGPELTQRDIVSLLPGTDYEVAVSYVVRGVRGDRLVLGPVSTDPIRTGAQFNQPTAPSAEESTEGQVWVDNDDNWTAYVRVAGTGRLAIGGNRITIGGNYIKLPWTPATSQPVRDAYENAEAALEAIDEFADDAFLNTVEKPILVKEAAVLEATWAVLDAQAASFSITTERTAASGARSNWLAMLAAITPPWDDTTVNSPITRATYDAARIAYDEALEDLTVAIAERANWSGIADDDGNRPEDQADVTSAIIGPSEITINADSGGAPLAGELPRYDAFKLLRNGVDVTTAAAWTRTLVSGASTTAVGAASGNLETSAIATAESRVRLTAAYGGTSRSFDVMIRRADAPPSSGGGGGGGTTDSQTSGFSTITTGTMAVISKVFSVTVGAAGKVKVTVNLQPKASGASAPAGTYEVAAIAQREISGVWTDIDTEIASNPDSEVAFEPPDYVRLGGMLGFEKTVSGLTPSSTAKFRVRARLTGATRSHYFPASAVVVDGTVT